MKWELVKHELELPFPARAIHWRPGRVIEDQQRCLALAYVDARDVQNRLDEVMGCDWQCKYTETGGSELICDIGLKIEGEWRWRSNGAGDTQVEAEKGKISDAFKRAAVMWGVGRYLYALGNTWADVEKRGRTWVIKTPPNLPKEATPEGWLAPENFLYQHMKAVREHYDAVATIKDGIACGDLPSAARAWLALEDEVRRSLWRAPKFGGVFSTREREIIHSQNFINYGEQAA